MAAGVYDNFNANRILDFCIGVTIRAFYKESSYRKHVKLSRITTMEFDVRRRRNHRLDVEPGDLEDFHEHCTFPIKLTTLSLSSMY